jgi:hypothetical protein
MSIQRVPAAPFAQIANDALRDRRLSFKARGLLAMVLSHSGEWEATIEWLCEQSEQDGKTSVQSALKELSDLGYRVVSHDRNRLGQVSTVVQWFHDSADRRSENPTAGYADSRSSRLSIEHNPQNTIKEHKPTTLADDAAETLNQRINRLTTVYTDLVPMSRFVAVMGIVSKAVRTGLYDDGEITDALARIAADGRSLTVETLRIELEGLAPFRSKPSGARMYADLLDGEQMAIGGVG